QYFLAMKQKCCTKAENSVYFEGAVGGMDEEAINKIIKKETSLSFMHIENSQDVFVIKKSYKFEKNKEPTTTLLMLTTNETTTPLMLTTNETTTQLNNLLPLAINHNSLSTIFTKI
ncbi:44607_t:CDS:2, partial [Gigaspora margarita]